MLSIVYFLNFGEQELDRISQQFDERTKWRIDEQSDLLTRTVCDELIQTLLSSLTLQKEVIKHIEADEFGARIELSNPVVDVQQNGVRVAG